MGKTLNELAGDLKSYILEVNSNMRSNSTFRPERYNNLKLSMDVAKEKIPHVTIGLGISEVTYNLNTLEKMDGSLGADEKYVQRWFNKTGVIEHLKAGWDKRVKNRGKITDVED